VFTPGNSQPDGAAKNGAPKEEAETGPKRADGEAAGDKAAAESSSQPQPKFRTMTREAWLTWRNEARQKRLDAAPNDKVEPIDYSNLCKLTFVEGHLEPETTVPYMRFEYAWESQADMAARLASQEAREGSQPVLPVWNSARANRDGVAGIAAPPDRSQQYCLHIQLRDEPQWTPLPLPGAHHPATLGHFYGEYAPKQALDATLQLMWWG
jgi:hypothetical protein